MRLSVSVGVCIMNQRFECDIAVIMIHCANS